MIRVIEGDKKLDLEFAPGDTILNVLQKANISGIDAPCNGKGVCKKCTVMVRGSSGTHVVLACKTKAEDNMVVEISPVNRISFADNSTLEICKPDNGQEGYAVAFDVGTTKIVGFLLDLQTGQLLASSKDSNRQSAYGTNVTSRLQAASEGFFEPLVKTIRKQLNRHLSDMCQEAGVDKNDVKQIVIIGNTLAQHFVAAINPTQDTQTPIEQEERFDSGMTAKEIGIDIDAEVFFAPIVDQLIGGDVISSIYAIKGHEAKNPILLMDLGSELTLVVGCGDKFVCCAADGGAIMKASTLDCCITASNGAISSVTLENEQLQFTVLGDTKPIGLCGSGLIDILAILYEEEVIDDFGHICDAEDVKESLAKHIVKKDGRNAFALLEDGSICLTEKDISLFLMAKAAMGAGIQIALDEYGIDINDVSDFFVSGGFGTFINMDNAAKLNMFPSILLSKCNRVGNSAAAGAKSAALSKDARNKFKELSSELRYVSLSEHPSFSDYYMDAMTFDY